MRLLLAALACVPATGHAEQRVTVVAPSLQTTVAVVRLWRRDGACWRPVAGPWPARVGRSGLSAHHREGDGTTPIGTFGFGETMYGLDPSPGVRYPYHRLVCGDWWDEDPSSATYDEFRHLRCGARPPFRGGSEALWQATRAYRRFAVLAYNTARVPGRGSAIFVHDDTGNPTNGCVSLPPGDLDQLLRWLDPAKGPVIVVSG